MKLGIIGLAGAGKATVFRALTRNEISEHKGESMLGAVHVLDQRIERLSKMYNPKKTTYAQILYSLPATNRGNGKDKEARLNLLRSCDVLIHVVRNFTNGVEPTALADLEALEQELIFADFVVVEKRIERIEIEKKRNRKFDEDELHALSRAKETLESDVPLRTVAELANSPKLKGFTFLSAKPMMYVFNNGDEDVDAPECANEMPAGSWLVIRGRLESELVDIPPDELGDFMNEFGIENCARDLVIEESFKLMGLASFFTVGEDEVRSWTIHKGTESVDAAEEIHSDIKKGFIRAEVVSYDSLMQAGNFVNARKAGDVRLEGKTYVVKDGDIINFRFNV